ncbi:hypothetical protein NMG60_11023632 [Bertholletia excelsa]
MAKNPSCTVYVGNLDERVSDRVLYDILIQAGRVVDLYIPRDKETDRPKGYAFAEYETEEIAGYAVRLFSGLVTLYNRTLKFAISGQDKPTQNLSTATVSTMNSSSRGGLPPVPFNNTEVSQHAARLSTSCRFSAEQISYGQVPPGVVHQPNGYKSQFDGNSRITVGRHFGATEDDFSRSRLSRFGTNVPTNYPSY